MKYTTVVLAAAAGVALAQESADFFPECALPCLAEAVESATSCSTDDGVCRCEPENKEAITGAATSCVISACGVAVAVGMSSSVYPSTKYPRKNTC